jgi:hypothetical protein
VSPCAPAGQSERDRQVTFGGELFLRGDKKKRGYKGPLGPGRPQGSRNNRGVANADQGALWSLWHNGESYMTHNLNPIWSNKNVNCHMRFALSNTGFYVRLEHAIRARVQRAYPIVR